MTGLQGLKTKSLVLKTKTRPQRLTTDSRFGIKLKRLLTSNGYISMCEKVLRSLVCSDELPIGHDLYDGELAHSFVVMMLKHTSFHLAAILAPIQLSARV